MLFRSQTKRGCPLHCSYCAYPTVEGVAGRLRPVEDVVDEIERVAAEVGPRTFEFVDNYKGTRSGTRRLVTRAVVFGGRRVV